MALGLAEAHVSRAKIPEFVAALEAGEGVDAAVARFQSEAAPGPIVQNRAAIDAAFSGASVGEILARLSADGSDFAKEAAKLMGQKAPLSLAVALRQMQVGAGVDFEEAMRTEFRIVSRICRGPNFYEGVRATIIDKDQKPAWKPARIEDVTAADVDAIFAPLGADELDLAGVAETAA
ncbi:MAG: enoyl-CoA hydratase/isomerase family protein [Rhodoblastus sp.]